MLLLSKLNSRSVLIFSSVLLSLFLFAGSVFAASVTLAWDRPDDADVKGYKIYYGLSGTDYQTNPGKTINSADQTEVDIHNLEEGKVYLFTATSHDGNDRESDFSEEISYQIPVSFYSIAATILPGQTGSIQASSGGFICRDNCAADFENGSSPEFSITPDNGYTISDVKVNGTSKGTSSSLTLENLSADQTITANFSLKEYSVTASADTGGSISPSGISTVVHGGSITYAIAPNDGYKIKDVIVNGASIGPVNTHTISSITKDSTIHATFETETYTHTYTITASAGTGGTISPSGSNTVVHGESITYTIAPDDAYKIKDVIVNGDSVGPVNSYPFSNITHDSTIHATFEKEGYTVTASAGTGGTISPDGSSTVVHGGSISYAISPDDDYKIKEVIVNGASIGPVNSYTFSDITEDSTIHATFEKESYTVTASAGTGGTITPSGSSTVVHGGSASYAIAPNDDYKIKDVTVNGSSVGAVESYTINSVTSDTTIKALFEIAEEADDETELPPDMPVLIKPAPNTELAPEEEIFLVTDIYTHPEGSAHIRSHWQIRRVDEKKPFYNVVSNIDLTTHKVSDELQDGLKYAWRAGFEDISSGLIAWSDESFFVVGNKILHDQNPPVSAGRSNNDYEMVSFGHWPPDACSKKVFDPMMKSDYSSGDYKILAYDPNYGQKGGFREYGDFEVVPGRSYWVLARYGMDLTTHGISVTSTSDIFISLDYNASNQDGWTMIAVPNNANYYWGDLEIVVHNNDGDILYGPIPIKQLQADNPYIDTRLWESKNRQNQFEIHNSKNFKLTPYSGYWVKARAENVSLSFPYDMQTTLANPAVMLAGFWNAGLAWIEKMLSPNPALANSELPEDAEMPPVPSKGLDEEYSNPDDDDEEIDDNNDKNNKSSGCFIGTAFGN